MEKSRILALTRKPVVMNVAPRNGLHAANTVTLSVSSGDKVRELAPLRTLVLLKIQKPAQSMFCELLNVSTTQATKRAADTNVTLSAR